MNGKRCPGYDEDGGYFDCDGTPGTPWTPIWCPECDERRKTRIHLQLLQLQSALREQDR